MFQMRIVHCILTTNIVANAMGKYESQIACCVMMPEIALNIVCGTEDMQYFWTSLKKLFHEKN